MEEEKEPLGDRRISKKQQAFEELTREHLASLYTIAVRLSRDKTVAEDLVQETYLKAYKSFEQFRKGSHCKAWLMKILTNVYLDWMRKAERKVQFVELDDADLGSLQKKEEGGQSIHSKNPEELVINSLFSHEINVALDDLPDEIRLTVLLADLEELSYREIADILHCPVGTVMSRLYRGRKALRNSLWAYAKQMGYIKG